jgi:NADH-quinone oxidoreductase subunit I
VSFDPKAAASYLDSIEVVEVQRGPSPGGAGGAVRAFGETLRGLKTTMSRLIEGPLTIEYPEEKTPVYPRFRGRHKLHRFEDTGLEKCVGCSLCAAACPADCIRVVAAENVPGEDRVSSGERYARSTSRAASSAATARSPARSTRSRWATTTRWPTTTAAT